MFFFNKERPPSRRTLKFYCVQASNGDAHIDRPALVDGLIAACETYFGQPPKKFDIGGPYGIRKGQPVGIRSFRNRLAKRGHEDYYALWAREEDSFGFDCSFRRLTSTEYTFSELLFWYETKKHDARILDIATDLIKVFPVDYGFVADFPDNYSLSWESAIKKTWSSWTTEPNVEFNLWKDNIASVFDGHVRKLYPYNFLNPVQTEALAAMGLPRATEFWGEISVLVLSDTTVLEKYNAVYEHAVRSRLNHESD